MAAVREDANAEPLRHAAPTDASRPLAVARFYQSPPLAKHRHGAASAAGIGTDVQTACTLARMLIAPARHAHHAVVAPASHGGRGQMSLLFSREVHPGAVGQPSRPFGDNGDVIGLSRLQRGRASRAWDLAPSTLAKPALRRWAAGAWRLAVADAADAPAVQLPRDALRPHLPPPCGQRRDLQGVVEVPSRS
jgi:hypothetical protein